MKNDWEKVAIGLLKVELAKQNLKYDDLRKKLEKIGIKESYSSIKGKLQRGRFSAVFLLQCLKAIDCENLRIEFKTPENKIR